MIYQHTFLGTISVNVTSLMQSSLFIRDARYFWVDKEGKLNYNGFLSEIYNDVVFTDNSVTYDETDTESKLPQGGSGIGVWEMNGHIYFNQGTSSYELDNTNTWVQKTWTFNLNNNRRAVIDMYGSQIWNCGNDYYATVRVSCTDLPVFIATFKYNTSTDSWDRVTTSSGALSPKDVDDGDKRFIWQDGTNAYFSRWAAPSEQSSSIQYKWDKTKMGWVAFSHTAVKQDGTTISNYYVGNPITVGNDIFSIPPVSNDEAYLKREVYKWNKTTQRWEYYTWIIDPHRFGQNPVWDETLVRDNKIYQIFATQVYQIFIN